uniref:Putative aluminum-activated malate transporter n=1 Tax=Davidia involucrata TaxID=16924 RepID=A0A5B7APH8_DAVIN
MGFSVCIFTSLFIFPMWASDELHYSVASKFENLACVTNVGCLEEYFRIVEEKENQPRANFSSCKSVLHSKSNEESLCHHLSMFDHICHGGQDSISAIGHESVKNCNNAIYSLVEKSYTRPRFYVVGYAEYLIKVHRD